MEKRTESFQFQRRRKAVGGCNGFQKCLLNVDVKGCHKGGEGALRAFVLWGYPLCRDFPNWPPSIAHFISCTICKAVTGQPGGNCMAGMSQSLQLK